MCETPYCDKYRHVVVTKKFCNCTKSYCYRHWDPDNHGCSLAKTQKCELCFKFDHHILCVHCDRFYCSFHLAPSAHQCLSCNCGSLWCMVFSSYNRVCEICWESFCAYHVKPKDHGCGEFKLQCEKCFLTGYKRIICSNSQCQKHFCEDHIQPENHGCS